MYNIYIYTVVHLYVCMQCNVLEWSVTQCDVMMWRDGSVQLVQPSSTGNRHWQWGYRRCWHQTSARCLPPSRRQVARKAATSVLYDVVWVVDSNDVKTKKHSTRATTNIITLFIPWENNKNKTNVMGVLRNTSLAGHGQVMLRFESTTRFHGVTFGFLSFSGYVCCQFKKPSWKKHMKPMRNLGYNQGTFPSKDPDKHLHTKIKVVPMFTCFIT